MLYEQVTYSIQGICEQNDCSFQEKIELLRKKLTDMMKEETLDEHLLWAGVVPERFAHDSTEEKLYAKYCDILLAESLSLLGISAEVLTERSDSADVLGGVRGKYSIVADAKAFRLSRTAKNQKDFKVEQLNEWRKGADYACLVSPLYQYPNTSSQIYYQAVRYNVTLLSYTHLYFLIKQAQDTTLDLRPLWEIGNSLTPKKSALEYWEAVDEAMCECSETNFSDWQMAKSRTLEILPKQAKLEIMFWEAEKDKIRRLNHTQAVEELIKALKIDSKIESIIKTAGI